MCAFMQADTSSETYARPPEGPEARWLDLDTACCDERHAESKP